ncbi:hypothetical protein [Spirosoma sp.]|uniref:hypothetical protein n=1 Tax=Spirosoma sp. TaxID=1899569 RepID=UPI003B3A14CC
MPVNSSTLNKVVAKFKNDLKYRQTYRNPQKNAGLLSRKVETISEERPVTQPSFVVAVDFDGTCVTHEFPKVGKDCPHAVDVLKEMVAAGAGIVLFTMRHGQYLDQAVSWFAERDIPLYGVQTNPTQARWTGSNKCYANVYIDDAALGCPLTQDESISKRPFVDWLEVDKLLRKHDWFMESIVS